MTPNIQVPLDWLLDAIIRHRDFAVLDKLDDEEVLTALKLADQTETLCHLEEDAHVVKVWRVEAWQARSVKSPTQIILEAKAKEHAQFIAAINAYRDLRRLIASKVSQAQDSELVQAIASRFREPTLGNRVALESLGLTSEQINNLFAWTGKIEIL